MNGTDAYTHDAERTIARLEERVRTLEHQNTRYKTALKAVVYYCERDAYLPAEKVARRALIRGENNGSST
jgi:hypothetical protein